MLKKSTVVLSALAGALGGAAAWAFVLTLSAHTAGGLVSEMMLGAVAGICIGAFLWSHETLSGRQYLLALKRAALGAVAGLVGGGAGALLGSKTFTALGKFAADAGGFKASLGVACAVALGWAILGATVGLGGGLMIRSRERAWYGVSGGALGGMVGGFLLNAMSATSLWSVLAGLALLGCSIGAFISLVEEVFVSAKLKVVKGRHINREFPLLKDENIVGRDDRSDVCLSGAEGVAIQHAVIKRSNGRFSIEADKDGKAVYVNQKMTQNSRLADGDIIRVGSILLMFSAVKKAAASSAAVFILVATLLLPVHAHAGEVASIRISQFDLSTYPTVKAYVSALNAEGRPARGLTKSDVSILENNEPVIIDTLRQAGTEGRQEPFSLAIVMDRSKSMTGEKITKAKEAVRQFLSLMEQGDRAALITFSDKVERRAALTDDAVRLKQALETIEPDGHTALYDAVAAGVDTVQGIPGRRAVIVLTDGIANRGALDIDQAIGAAVKAYVSVYVIGLGKDVRTERLERIAEETGAFYFFTPAPDGLAQIYDTISRRIRGEYIVTYATNRRAEYLRSVTLSVKNGPQASRAYFQPESSLFGAGLDAPRWPFVVSLACVLALFGMSFRNVERVYTDGHLTVVRGQGTKKDIDINDAVTIGRDKHSTISLFKDAALEQNHAQVLRENGMYVIEDRSSKTGTFVNKKRVTGKQVLEDGDVIDMGGATIVFSSADKHVCAGCGAAVRTGAKFCAFCGAKAA
ncbi:MAG TPA: VWA domain-containing protein [Nitrospirota bacterium]|nr:VWA domain-containing protein [Nitrospirota bacterium]